jgi:hypothetical protein
MIPSGKFVSDTSAEALRAITEPISVNDCMPVRGWEIMYADVGHLDHVIARAPEFGINHIQIGGGLLHRAIQLLDEPWRVSLVNRVIERAHKQGIELFIWTHELDGLPPEFFQDGRVDLRSDAVWELLERRYAEVFKVIPDVDGLVLSIQETQVPISEDSKVISDEPAARRMVRLVNRMHDICVRHGKKLIFRLFYYNKDEIDFMCRELQEIPAEVMAMAKCQVGDWSPIVPHESAVDPVLASGRQVLIEYDLGDEYYGQCEFPYIVPAYLQYRMNHFANLGVCGSVARLERYFGTALGTMKEVDLEVFGQLLQQPSAAAAVVAMAAMTRRFCDWAEPVMAIFEDAAPVIDGVAHPGRVGWGGFMNHSAISEVENTIQCLHVWAKHSKWIDCADTVTLADRILNGEDDVVDAMRADLDRTLEGGRNIMRRVDTLDGSLPIELFTILRSAMSRMEAWVEMNLPRHRCFLELQRYCRTRSPQHKARVESELEALAAAERIYGGLFYSMKTEGVHLNKLRYGRFVREVNAALDTGKHVASDTVVTASDFGLQRVWPF